MATHSLKSSSSTKAQEAPVLPPATRSHSLNRLDQLEAEAIYILREAYHRFSHLALLWSMGKDSNVLLWLTQKAFCGSTPFPLLHIDTTYEFPEMLAFRKWAQLHYQFELLIATNQAARTGASPYQEIIGYETHDPVTVTHELKTVALKQALAHYRFDGLITGIRRDEDGVRAKERYFSPRNPDSSWDYKEQPPEFWGHFGISLKEGGHCRIQPLLDWQERDIWQYIDREQIPIPKLYFSRSGKRYRSLGCSPITHPISSQATTIAEIIQELHATKTSERSGRAQDHHQRYGMQLLRKKGFL